MTDTDALSARESYLARLDAAMRDLPHGVAVDIRQGVAEELEGLDAVATADRIAQLGDPAGIAAGAQGEIGASSATPISRVPDARPTASTRGFALAGALVLGFGGVIVPGVGWAVGAVLVGLSPLWRVWEKVVAILLPLIAVVIAWAIVQVVALVSAERPDASTAGAVNPLVPDLLGFGSGHMIILLGFLSVPVSGLWLLLRLRRRPGRR